MVGAFHHGWETIVGGRGSEKRRPPGGETIKGRSPCPKHKTPQSHIPVVRGAAIVANTGEADAGEIYFRRCDGDGIGEFSTLDGHA